MRKILFRGKIVRTGEWVCGGIVHQTDHYGEPVDRYFIIDGTETQDYDIGYEYEVIPETVGQFTGLYDKNGKRIFEGDIVEYEFDEIGKQLAVIVYSKEYAAFRIKPINNFQFALMQDGIVIGNIHDNPELLEDKR